MVTPILKPGDALHVEPSSPEDAIVTEIVRDRIEQQLANLLEAAGIGILSDYWYSSGSQEGCHFDAKSQANFLKVLEPILRKSGLRTVISASDETNTTHSKQAWNTYEQNSVLNLIKQWNTHTYTANNYERAQIGALARAAGKQVWMSESGSDGDAAA